MRSAPKMTCAVAALAVLGLAAQFAVAAEPTKTVSDREHLQNLRAIRKTLENTRETLRAEPMGEGDANREAAVKSLEAAIQSVNSEVIEFEKKHPDLKK